MSEHRKNFKFDFQYLALSVAIFTTGGGRGGVGNFLAWSLAQPTRSDKGEDEGDVEGEICLILFSF